MVTYHDIQMAQQRIAPYVHKTPIVSSHLLNQWLGHEIFFKAECLQKIGAFKIRGATNFIAKLRESGDEVNKVVANSSGNHAQAVALASQIFSIPSEIYAAQNISPVKANATKYYGAELHLFDTRLEADAAIQNAAQEEGIVWIPPFNHPDIIAGQGTATAEALAQISDVDAVFAPCGGGGLLSGSYVATRALAPNAKVIGAEPLQANDAAKSRRAGKIIALDGPAQTLADGAATPSVGEHTFPIIQQVDDFYEVDEQGIIYWTQWLQHLLKLHVEPTSALAMDAVVRWLSTQNKKQRVLVILSGGNISSSSMHKIWLNDNLNTLPSLN
ncbi:serine/threonine dehydratase [Glaciecola sp. 1036]|uniref:serine/threonine dehydratase n=1 Tax=Alteromonadaceae TaxID=72275 RepID=UPI003D0360C5